MHLNAFIRKQLIFITVIFGFIFLSLAAQSKETTIAPNIIDFRELVEQRYSKKQFSVLADTVQSYNFPNKKWVVLDTIYIPKDSILEIPKDVSLFFEPNASIVVAGVFKVIGTNSDPIYMSKIDSSEMLKKPSNNMFYWGGITIEKTGKLILKNVKISNISNGISSNGICDSMVIENVQFLNSSPFKITYIDNSISIKDTTPFELHCNKVNPSSKKNSQNKYLIKYSTSVGTALLVFGTLYGLAHKYDHDAVKVKDHKDAQALADKATNLYNASLISALSSSGLLSIMIAFDIMGNRKDK